LRFPPIAEESDRQIQASGIPLPSELAYDRGGKGSGEIIGVKILIPSVPKKQIVLGKSYPSD